MPFVNLLSKCFCWPCTGYNLWNTAVICLMNQKFKSPYLRKVCQSLQESETFPIYQRLKLVKSDGRYLIPVIKKVIDLNTEYMRYDAIIGWETNRDVEFISHGCKDQRIKLTPGITLGVLHKFQRVCQYCRNLYKITGNLPDGIKLYCYAVQFPFEFREMDGECQRWFLQ